ncbi:MAG: hypothetical protein AAF221_02500 [Pseudomonadota bacterium]
MFRVIWFIGCLIVAGLLAVIGKSLIPFVVSEFSADGVSHGIYDLLSRASIVRSAITIGLFTLFFTLLSLGGQVLNDALTMRRFHQQIAKRAGKGNADTAMSCLDFLKLSADAGDYAEPSALYAEHRTSIEKEPLRAKLPARTIFDEQSQVRSRLNLWLFDNILTFALGAGFTLFLLSLVIGVDDVVFQSQLSLRTPVNGLLPALQSGLFALAIMAIAGLLARLFTGFVVDLRRSQLARFTVMLDGLFYVGQSAIESLQKPLKSLSDAQALIAEDRSEQLSKTMAQALESFKEGLTGEFTKQIKSTSKLLEETEKQVTKSTVAVEAAHDALAKYARGQSTAIDKSIAAALNTYFKDETKTRAGLNQAISESMEAASNTLKSASQGSADTLKEALAKLNESYGGGLTDTAQALKQTQQEMSGLVRAIEHLAAQRPAAPAGQREDYLRLVGDEDFSNDPPPLHGLGSGGKEGNTGEQQLAQLREVLKGKPSGAKNGPKGAKKATKEMSSKLDDLKKGLDPDELPDL